MPRFLLVTVVLIAALAACASPALAEDAPPVITDGSATPDTLMADGGQVEVSGTATDDVGLARVYAYIVGENGTYIEEPMASVGGDVYRGTAAIPSNGTEYSIQYTVNVIAVDTSGQETWLGVGQVRVEPRPFVNDPPFVVEPFVSPRELPSGGGALNLAVSAWDLGGISEAYAMIDQVGGDDDFRVDLSQTAETRWGVGVSFYKTPSTTARRYAVTFYAHDDIGQISSISGGEFVVAAAAPATPAKLQVSPALQSFGTVRVGQEVVRNVTIRNVGGARVTGTVGPVAAPFAAGIGAYATGVPFDLSAGQSMTVPVRFTPRSVGFFTRELRVRRTDGQQTGLGVRLAGVGLPRRQM
ncbi:MAG: choice-of-anchor D domain-containing protein [Solirubrobacteraceae bacterium]|nr:choice-of-anchor D domain-containing protein [Solirubrobacteraceae bacterium]